MIGIVVVSHSRALADAAVALAADMVDADRRPQIRMAAGLDADTFGTDASAVAAAISDVDGPDGVLVLLDLGSAVLSAEMALEFVDTEVAKRVVLSSAPLVEGLVAAVVTASTGATLDAVAEEALDGLTGKQEHLGVSDASGDGSVAAGGEPAPGVDGDRLDGGVSRELEVSNEHGLHARPAARLVALVRSHDARVALTNVRTGKGPVDARSLTKVATLDARQGDRVKVIAAGPQAEEVLAAVAMLAEANWGDDSSESPKPPDPTTSRTGSGLDVALGPAVVTDADVDLAGYVPAEPGTERSRSDAAVAAALAQIDALERHSAEAVGADAAAIFAAHRAMLDDPDLLDDVRRDIDSGRSAPDAWSDRLGSVAAAFEALPDPYQQERAQDVRSVLRRVHSAFVGEAPAEAEQGGGILVVPELDAATAAVVDIDDVTGIITIAGGATGHGVIVARSRGIPIVTDLGAAAAAITGGTMVAFDARTRRLEIDPDAETQAEFRALIEHRSGERAAALAAATGPAVTTDGCRIVVNANVTSVGDAHAAAEQGADGSGLVRTEVLFGGWRSAPGVTEQAAAFGEIADALKGRSITIRTWDVGGDKPLAFLPQPREANPFLGERGLRLLQRQPQVLVDQLRAVCLVAREHPVQVMFPMVTTRAEVDWALERLREAARDTGGEPPQAMKVGIMVEVPAAAVRIRQIAAGLDFVSIGTNDLTQYTTAAERGNAAVAALADALDPAVLELVRHVCAELPDDVAVAVCGDLAGDPAAAVLLVGLGVRELSAVGPQVPLVKARLREVSLGTARQLAAQALSLSSATDVRELLQRSGDPGAVPADQRTPQE